LLKVGIVLEV